MPSNSSLFPSLQQWAIASLGSAILLLVAQRWMSTARKWARRKPAWLATLLCLVLWAARLLIRRLYRRNGSIRDRKHGKDVVVHGVGKREEIAEAVVEIGESWKKIIERSRKNTEGGVGMQQRRSRQLTRSDEWSSFVDRLNRGKAYPVLRKFFRYYGGDCNVEQASSLQLPN